MSRKESRERVFKLIFEYVFTREIDDDLLADYLSEIGDEKEKEYASRVYFGVAQNFDYLWDKIEKVATGYSSKRIYKVDMALMMLALYEIEFEKDIPTKVSINEVINLSKIYSTEKSASFINGVLAKVI